MTGRERILTALEKRAPDRVPTCEWILNPRVMEKVCGVRDDIAFVAEMGLDGIAVGLDSDNVKIDERHIKDEWGITRVSYDEYPNPVGHPIRDMSDLKNFVPPEPLKPYRFDRIKKALDACGPHGKEICVIPRVRDVFSQPRDLMGYENFLISFYEDPALANALMAMSADYSIKICDGLVKLGIEVIVVGDDIANNDSLLLSPGMYREYVYPHFARLVGHAKKLGLKVIKHSDGDLREVIGDLVKSGIDCLDPIDERGNMFLDELKAKYGDSIAFKGNVDCVETLVSKSVEEVRAETARCMLKGGIDGGLIISSSNSIHSGISPVNYRAFLDAVKEFGNYPLDVPLLTKIAEAADHKFGEPKVLGRGT
jgi:uroporphyrinogen decarboxylase